MSYVTALDVSQWQGFIDWKSVDRDIAIIKMSGGDSGLYVDKSAMDNYYGAANANKAIAMYHFAGGQDATNEADFFIAACSPLEENDVMVLDWEIPHNNPVGWCKAFRDRVHDRTGVWVLLYINLATLNQYDWSTVLDNSGLWLAAWNDDPEATLTDKTYVMHQYTSSGTVPGIAGRVDLDAWFGTVEQFKQYGYHAIVPEQTPPPPVAAPTPGTNIDGVIPTTPPARVDPPTPGTVVEPTTPPTPVVPPTNQGVNMLKYNKFIVALIAALTILTAAIANGTITGAEWVQIGAGFLGALGVRQITNEK